MDTSPAHIDAEGSGDNSLYQNLETAVWAFKRSRRKGYLPLYFTLSIASILYNNMVIDDLNTMRLVIWEVIRMVESMLNIGISVGKKSTLGQGL